MAVYDLGLDEVVIMQESNVFSGGSNVTLILTNQNLIEVTKGFWGSDKGSNKYPLLNLKEYNGKPNVLVGKGPNGKTRLELYFTGYEKYYSFQGMLAERKWAGAIEKAYKACVAEQKKCEKPKLDVGTIFAPIKGTLESAKHAVIPKTKEPKTKMVKCPRCGAELTGEKGKEVKCSYCEAIVTIK